jgi:D-glycero-alpha-D-manno-heptose 1-phosphate guanylyltransferase
MEAVILAGGFGTRLQAVVPNLPKPMAPVAGRPFLEILLSALRRKGFNRVVLSLGYRAEQIMNHFGTGFLGLSLDYVVETTPLGTGGATRLALSRCRSNPVFIFNGDTFLDLEIETVVNLWGKYRKPIITARRVEDTYRYGSLLLSDDRVVGFSEKGVHGEGLINAGCYVFPRDLLDEYPLFQAFSLESDFLTRTIITTEFLCFETKGMFIDIGVPEDYQSAQTLLAEIP